MLYERFMQEYILMEKKRVSDGEGGFHTQWQAGIHINLSVTQNTTMQARIAEHEGVTSTYTVTANKNVKLDFHDVIKRIEDGAVFRVTSNSGQKVSPNFSPINMIQVSAERWEIPDE